MGLRPRHRNVPSCPALLGTLDLLLPAGLLAGRPNQLVIPARSTRGSRDAASGFRPRRGGRGVTRKPTAGSAPRARAGWTGTAPGAPTALRSLADIMLQFLVSGAAEKRAGGLAQGPRRLRTPPGRLGSPQHPPPPVPARSLSGWAAGFCLCLAQTPSRCFSAALPAPKTRRCPTERACSEPLAVRRAPRPLCNPRVKAVVTGPTPAPTRTLPRPLT